MPVSARVISIGTLASHPLRNEPADLRTGHATTSLVVSGKHRILVDPSLPPQVVAARLDERAGLKPSDITHVFLTSFDRDRRRCVGSFERARWLIAPNERDFAQRELEEMAQAFERSGNRDLASHCIIERQALSRMDEAEDELAPGVALFPMPGVTPGLCGLILSQPTHTLLICGDAVPTLEHLEQGKVLPGAKDVEQAQESFREAVEIADILILGRDNWSSNPLRGVV